MCVVQYVEPDEAMFLALVLVLPRFIDIRLGVSVTPICYTVIVNIAKLRTVGKMQILF